MSNEILKEIVIVCLICEGDTRIWVRMKLGVENWTTQNAFPKDFRGYKVKRRANKNYIGLNCSLYNICAWSGKQYVKTQRNICTNKTQLLCIKWAN